MESNQNSSQHLERFTHLWVDYQNSPILVIYADERINYVRTLLDRYISDLIASLSWPVDRPVAEVANNFSLLTCQRFSR